MAHDIIIRGGRIVDGLLNPQYIGDVAIEGDTITALGEVDGRGKREIDAEGAVVTPGFIDLHVHLTSHVPSKLGDAHSTTVGAIANDVARHFLDSGDGPFADLCDAVSPSAARAEISASALAIALSTSF